MLNNTKYWKVYFTTGKWDEFSLTMHFRCTWYSKVYGFDSLRVTLTLLRFERATATQSFPLRSLFSSKSENTELPWNSVFLLFPEVCPCLCTVDKQMNEERKRNLISVVDIQRHNAHAWANVWIVSVFEVRDINRSSTVPTYSWRRDTKTQSDFNLLIIRWVQRVRLG